MSELLAVKDRVGRQLTQLFDTVRLDKEAFLVEFGSSLCWIEVIENSDPDSHAYRLENDLPNILIYFWALIALDVPARPEMFQWLAIEGQQFKYGGMKATLSPGGTYMILYQYAIAGESADPMDIKNAVIGVCTTADEYDDEFVQMFGGRTYAQGKEKTGSRE